jgi:hypothetical protein
MFYTEERQAKSFLHRFRLCPSKPGGSGEMRVYKDPLIVHKGRMHYPQHGFMEDCMPSACIGPGAVNNFRLKTIVVMEL